MSEICSAVRGTNLTNRITVTRECSKEHVPRADNPAGICSCSTHKYLDFSLSIK